MSTRVPQLTDRVTVEVLLPPTTEEWADEILAEHFDAHRDSEGHLVVRETVGGNCNALVNARMFLEEIEDALREAYVDPMWVELHAWPEKDA